MYRVFSQKGRGSYSVREFAMTGYHPALRPHQGTRFERSPEDVGTAWPKLACGRLKQIVWRGSRTWTRREVFRLRSFACVFWRLFPAAPPSNKAIDRPCLLLNGLSQ